MDIAHSARISFPVFHRIRVDAHGVDPDLRDVECSSYDCSVLTGLRELINRNPYLQSRSVDKVIVKKRAEPQQ